MLNCHISLYAQSVKVYNIQLYLDKMEMMHMMQMYFHLGYHEIILLRNWHTTNSTQLIGAVIGIIILGCVYEALKGIRNDLFIKAAQARKLQQGKLSKCSSICSSVHLAQTALHGLQLLIGYILMLIFMTYNVYLCMAVVVGGTFGYWLFSADKSNSDNIECCF